jgi:hypothetical protein
LGEVSVAIDLSIVVLVYDVGVVESDNFSII